LVLDSIYEKYGFEDKKLKSYPPLVKRKEIVSNSSNRMESLLILYEFGIASLLSKQFDLAIDLFEIIIEEGFQSKEVYNNLGLSYFQKALSLTPEDSLTYTYPFDMDFTSNLEQQRDFSPSEDEVKEFYKRSLECFDNALNIDKKYIKALTNKAILQFHTESVELPIVLAQLKVNAADTDSYKLLILLIDHKSGNINTSLDKMSEMAEYNSCASLNLSKIGGVKSVKKRALKNNEMIIKIYDHHDFLDRERGEEALENARAFRGNMVLTKLNIPMKLRILFDDEIYALKWGNERRLFKIKSPKLINEITSGLTSSNNKSIDYIVFNEFVLKINYGEIQFCYIVL
jgi:tetratricopeptide (TPR) repeat protein